MFTREYRPNVFSEVAGQSANVEVLRAIVNNPSKAPRSIIMRGDYGTGKTTMARIFARALNCLSDVPNPPCGHCEVCKSSLDFTPYYQEFDSSDVGNKEAISNMKSDFFLKSGACKWRVIVFDECLSYDAPVYSDAGGYRKIGDLVRDKDSSNTESVNLETGEVEYKKIEAHYNNGPEVKGRWRKVEWDGEKTYITANHEVLVEGNMVPLENLPPEFWADRVMYDISGVREQVLLGTLLGDSFTTMRKHARVEMHQGYAQRDYLDWKVGLLGFPLGGWPKTKTRQDRYVTYADPAFDRFHIRKGNRKFITKEWLEKMGPLAWAVWYMDDGHLTPNNNIYYSCTNLGEDTYVVSEFLFSMGYKNSVYKNWDNRVKRFQYRIYLHREASLKFGRWISPYIQANSVMYKDGWHEPKVKLECGPLRKKNFESALFVRQTPFEGKLKYRNTRYCIGVEDNHNFVLRGGFTVSNCHLISKAAQGALLKTLEEMPDNLFVVFCHPEGKRVETPNGRKRIEDFEKGDVVYTEDGIRKVKRVYDNGLREMVKIRLSNGQELIQTPSHEYKIMNSKGEFEWVETKNLRGGEIFPLRMGLAPVTTSGLSLPECEFVGRMAGAGYYNTKYGIFFNSAERDYGVSLLEAAGVKYSKEYKRGEVSEFYLPVGPNEFKFRSMGFRKYKNKKQIPESAHRMSQDELCRFLKGLFEADGHVDSAGYYRLTTDSREFAQDVADLLLSIGYASNIYEILREVKEESAAVGVKKGEYTTFQVRVKGREFASVLKHGIWKKPDYGRHPVLDYDFPVVVEVVKDCERPAYDIEVEGIHQYYVGGAISHNCTTDIQLVQDTIRSRSVELVFRKLTLMELKQNLIRVSRAEGLDLPDSELERIAMASKGHVRDSVMILDIYSLMKDKAVFFDMLKSAEIPIINLLKAVKTNGVVDNQIEAIIRNPLDTVKHDFYTVLRNMVYAFAEGKVESFYLDDYKELAELWGQDCLKLFAFSQADWAVNSFREDVTVQAFFMSLVCNFKIKTKTTGSLLERAKKR